MNWLIVVLRLIHIGAGVFWAGSVLAWGSFVLPAVAASGEEGQRFLGRLMHGAGLSRAMVGAGVVTVLAGFALLGLDSAGFQPSWMGSGMGVMISIAALAALGALFSGIRAAALGTRLGAVQAAIASRGGAPDPAQAAEARAVGARLARVARAEVVMITIAVLFMAVARYVVF